MQLTAIPIQENDNTHYWVYVSEDKVQAGDLIYDSNLNEFLTAKVASGLIKFTHKVHYQSKQVLPNIPVLVAPWVEDVFDLISEWFNKRQEPVSIIDYGLGFFDGFKAKEKYEFTLEQSKKIFEAGTKRGYNDRQLNLGKTDSVNNNPDFEEVIQSLRKPKKYLVELEIEPQLNIGNEGKPLFKPIIKSLKEI